MNQFISFPSISDFKSVIKQVKNAAHWNNTPIPKIMFRGTVKLHGTNAAVIYKDGEIYAQSRERVLTIESDNYGFAMFVERNKQKFIDIFNHLVADLKPKDGESIQLYGEWCGRGIQKSVGIANLEKMFVVFAVRVSENAESQNWIDVNRLWHIKSHDNDIRIITEFRNWILEIDFESPQSVQNRLAEMTIAVESDCPVARKLLPDFEGELIGEGIVWEAIQTVHVPFDVKGLRFKVKGEKHSNSKVKKLVPIDVEKVNSVNEFVDTVVTENRLKQGIDKLGEMGLEVDKTNTSNFIKWVVGDVLKEERDRLVESGLAVKDVNGPIATRSRNYFMKVLNETT